jgi:hypothetical protein
LLILANSAKVERPMSLMELENLSVSSDERAPLVSDELLETAGGNFFLANRMAFQNIVKLDLDANPTNIRLVREYRAAIAEVLAYKNEIEIIDRLERFKSVS